MSGPLLDLLRADIAVCGAQLEDALAAPGEPARLAAVAKGARTVAGGARLLGIEPATRLALAIEDTAGAAGRGGASMAHATAEAMRSALALLVRIAAAGDDIAAWMAQSWMEVDAAVAAIARGSGLPARAPSRPAAVPEATPVVAPAVSGRRAHGDITVLLVDDQRMIAVAIRQMLAGEAGIRLFHCSDPAQALAMAVDVQPTVILQDLVMPDIDGLTLVRYFRAHPATVDVPIVALSTRDDAAVKAESFQVGANDYVVKLPDKIELVARIRYLSKGYLHLLDSREAWAALVASQKQLEIRNRFIRHAFGRYVSDEVVESLLETPGGLDFGGETRRVTIMMTDLRGFTPLCETLEPGQVVAILNNYLAAMTDVVMRHGGTIDEFIGDAILAVFGAPVRRADDARRAVACAIDMQRAMDGVNARNRELGLPRVEMGIGLETGEVVVGNIGSHRRAKYGVVGRVVNLSSRIEAHTIGGQILASAATVRDAGPGVVLGGQLTIAPKGVAAPMVVHDVRGIGAPYHLELPARSEEPLIALAAPLAVRVLVVKDKSAAGDGEAGELVAMSARVVRVRSRLQVAAMENVKVEIREGALAGVELWGKIVAGEAEEGGFDVWCAAIPEGVAALAPGSG
jgi:adenylate cyclase